MTFVVECSYYQFFCFSCKLLLYVFCNCDTEKLGCYLVIFERLVQVMELQEENSSIQKQLEIARNVTDQDVTRDTEHAGKVDRNANLPLTHISDELSASDAKHLENLEAAQQQVVIMSLKLEY